MNSGSQKISRNIRDAGYSEILLRNLPKQRDQFECGPFCVLYASWIFHDKGPGGKLLSQDSKEYIFSRADQKLFARIRTSSASRKRSRPRKGRYSDSSTKKPKSKSQACVDGKV
mmetsp:Transcript_33762/g.65703  ORF Transcript_33762/g.65703 Transcript_33762/m.65703 type:complete len:114 (+) Transcript_33762:113-454(+)